MRESKDTAKHLFEIADTQYGFFTTKQAKEVGYFDESLAYHVRAGNWVREHRGIYRLANYPLGERPDLMLWYLWSRNRNDKPQGIYSHDTALALHDLSDINPSRIHMTVPKNFRRNAKTPKVLAIHYGNVSTADFQEMFGVAVTRPLRTILDIVTEGTLSESLIKQAISEALQRGLIPRNELEKAMNLNKPLSVLAKGI